MPGLGRTRPGPRGTRRHTEPARRADGSSATPGPAEIDRAQVTSPIPQRADRVLPPIRSATTVAGIVGHACSDSRIRGSTSSTNKPAAPAHTEAGPSLRSAAFTVFFEHPTARVITLIGIPSP